METHRVYKEAVDRLLTVIAKTMCPENVKVSLEDSWETLCVSAFWSGPIKTPEKWVDMLCQRDISVSSPLEASLLYFSPLVFFRFFPIERYVAEWPYMRGFCPRAAFEDRSLYDMFWSVAAAGSHFVPPLPAWFDLTKTQRKLLVFVLRHMGKTSADYCTLLDHDLSGDLNHLQEQGFLCADSLGRWFRDSAYINYQIPLPVRTIRYRVGSETRKRTCVTSASY